MSVIIEFEPGNITIKDVKVEDGENNWSMSGTVRYEVIGYSESQGSSVSFNSDPEDYTRTTTTKRLGGKTFAIDVDFDRIRERTES